MLVVSRRLAPIGLLVLPLLVCASAARAQQPADVAPISSFIEGVQKIMLTVGKIDGMIDAQITKEKRRALIRELTRLNRALSDLEQNKSLFTDLVTDDEVNWDDLRARMSKIRENATDVRKRLYAVGTQLSLEGALDGGYAIEKDLTQGIDEKIGTLKEIERALLRGRAGSDVAVDRAAMVQEGRHAVELVQRLRAMVTESIRKLSVA